MIKILILIVIIIIHSNNYDYIGSSRNTNNNECYVKSNGKRALYVVNEEAVEAPGI